MPNPILPVSSMGENRTNTGRSYSHMDDGGFSWLTAMGFGFLSFNTGMAILRSGGDSGSVAFVGISYLNLMLLFWLLRRFEQDILQYGRGRGTLKASIWALSTLLGIMYSFKMEELFPQPISGMSYFMSCALSLLMFYSFFISRCYAHFVR
jgi:Family of unknown function (DUF6490)